MVVNIPNVLIIFCETSAYVIIDLIKIFLCDFHIFINKSAVNGVF